jgi:uncharacterized protein YndB with AHSA1/START domain
MRALKFLAIVIVLVVGCVFIMGYRLPQNHSVSVEKEFAYPPDKVYGWVSSPSSYPKWRSGVQKVEILADSEKMQRFREVGLHDEITYVVEQNVPNKLYVTRIAQQGLSYGGAWTFEFEPTAKGTNLRITEDGEVYSPFFRFVSHYIMKPTGSINSYMHDLEKKLSAPET